MDNNNVYVQCQCGHMHPETDTEVIMLKILKGKDCDISSLLSSFASTGNVVSVAKTTPLITNTQIEPASAAAPVIPVKPPVIPNNILSMMLPESHPDFDARGAKEVRRI